MLFLNRCKRVSKAFFINLLIMNNPIKVALVGYGMSAKVFHAPLLTSIKCYEIVVINERFKSESKKDFPKATIVRSFEEILTNSEIELVIINTPNQLHYSQAKTALLADKNVVIEKPFTVSIAEAEELVELAKKRGKTLSVFHNRRWDSDFLWLQELVNSGLKIYEIESRFDRFRDYLKGWKEEEGEGSGILYDIGSHLIDQMLVLFGDNLQLNYVDLQKQRSAAKTIDSFELHFKAKEIKVILKASMTCSHSYRLKVDTELGTFIKRDLDTQESILKKCGLSFSKDKVTEEVVDFYHPNGSVEIRKIPQGDYLQFYKQLYKAIRKDGLNPVTPISATKVVGLIDECMKKNR